ncbi:MAG: Signal peptidase-like protein [Bacteroidetes bacterium SW_11_45_7]|nr:MAG: Signal peptidase-like protein [Bacteroidetes bacterium SW_11_45_7]
MGCDSCGTSGQPAGCQNNGNCLTEGCNKSNTFDWLADIPVAEEDTFNIHELSFKEGSTKAFYRNDKNLDLTTGDFVVVEGNPGYDVGEVSLSGELVRLQMKKKSVRETSEDVKSILRMASDNDMANMKEARRAEKEMLVRGRAIIGQLDLDMKLSDIEMQADHKKAVFFYTADGRVDFRDLIKELAREFKVKVEMRQIGPRQEAGRIGGIGDCGRELCCSTWLSDFKSVSTSAARYQNLSINQEKLSGQCGRLKCCLNYELDTYLDALEDIPKEANKLLTKKGTVYLQKTDIFKRLMWYSYPEDSTTTSYCLTVDQVKQIQAMNQQNEYPEELVSQQQTEKKEQEEESEEFGDVVGEVNLSTLEKSSKARSNKNKHKGQGRGKRKKRNRGGNHH